MWIINALIVHVLLLGSIFVIYFRSPIISGLRPQNVLTLEPPAKRLVLIVTDGLRAESFFRNKCSDVPHIRTLMSKPGGLVGVSHTRVPTESRPGHIALIAGLYEDPSAVTRGWKENPIDFDTVFNRSASTYAWGANDVLHIFDRLNTGGQRQRLFVDAYDHDLDFSGRDKTYALDDWVFERVRLLLRRKRVELRKEQQLVFFLHLLGLDSAGHIHKPGSELFLENLNRTDGQVKEMYEYFEETFRDQRTAYILTSDHGMTNAGSHGAGDPLETETPFFLWGAGISHTAPHGGKTFDAGEVSALPLHSMEQAQMAPLMSALLGLPPPMNNFGTLPVDFLNASTAFKAEAVHSNALQLLEQFQALLSMHQRGFFSGILRRFDNLDEASIAAYISTSKQHRLQGDYDAAINASMAAMHAALDGIDYYHGYYRIPLLLSTTATFAGWIAYLLQLLLIDRGCSSMLTKRRVLQTLSVGVTLVGALVLLQRMPFVVAFYLALPVPLWLLVVQHRNMSSLLVRLQGVSLLKLAVLIACAELLVYTFFERRVISIAFVIFSLLANSRAFHAKDLKFFTWLLLVLAISMFPLLPPSVGNNNTHIFALGMLLTMTRPFATKARIGRTPILVACIAMANALLCAYQHSNQIGISLFSQVISWSFLIYTAAAIALHPELRLKHRVEFLLFTLTSLYALFCTSYESLFVVMLASELMLSLDAHESVAPSQFDVNRLATNFAPPTVNSARNLQMSFRLAFAILLYAFFSFFGTGNIASVSSFDPNIIRCFLTTFSPFSIMALVLLKLLIPLVLNLSIVFAMSDFVRSNERQIFICLLLLCDVMGLNFLFLVRNRGSWLEIGSSISHFVIMEVTTLVLLILAYLAKVLLRIDTHIYTKVK